MEEEKSIGGNIWKTAPTDERASELLVQRFGLPALAASILVNRGISSEEVEDFIYPKLNRLLPNPSVLKDMDKAAVTIAEAVVCGKKIAIIGDYDVDGATSSSVLRLFLEACGSFPDVHIPERDEGYGPSFTAVDNFAAAGCDLLITTDCGTTAFEVLEYASEKGMKVVVLDHHEAEIRLPKVCAVVNPKRLDDDSGVPYLKYMAAVGVVFMTIVAVNRELRRLGFYQGKEEPDLMQWLDLAALGTVCDVVPLRGLNRAFVRQGLKVMAARKNCGLKALIEKSGIGEALSAFHLGYVLGPRINACGRVGDSSLGHRMLCCRDMTNAVLLADKLDEFNVMRKDIESYVLLQAIEILEGTPQAYPIAFVAGRGWHQGVVGIVAGKLRERYNLPAFVMSIEDDEVKGSARSIPEIDLGALIIAAKEKGLITKGGGHAMAAGFSLEENKIEAFKEFVGQYAASKTNGEVVPVLEVDGVLDAGAATWELAEKLELLEPFGAGNPEPKLMLQRVKISRSGVVGSGHVRCTLVSESGMSLKAMAFRCADNNIGKTLLSANGELYEAVGVLRKDMWQGRRQVQFLIDDIRKV